MTEVPDRYAASREPFGRWLLTRPDRRNWTDDLAKVARADTLFPKAGDIAAVRSHLEKRGADSDMFERLDDAELDYLAI